MKNIFLSKFNPLYKRNACTISDNTDCGKKHVSPNAFLKLSLYVAFIPLCVIALILANSEGEMHSNAQADPISKSANQQQILPSQQDASCPDFELLAIPGTYDSNANADPFHPHSSRDSVLYKIVTPLSAKYSRARLEAYTVPYMAQLRSRKTPYDATFEQSHLQGQHRVEQRLRQVNAHCPLTKFVIVGFSQGAQIAGDIAEELGEKQQPIDPKMVSYIALISDPRRVHGKSFDIAPSPAGDGIETTIGELDAQNPQTEPGTQLTRRWGMAGPYHGARLHDFGTMNNRVSEICAPLDGICDFPKIDPNASMKDIAQAFSPTLPRHIGYGTPFFWSVNGQSAAQWIIAKISALIDATPPVQH